MKTSVWNRRPLGSLADLCLGKMLDQNKNRGEPFPYLANVNVRWGEFTLDKLKTMRFEPKEMDRYGLKFGDIVMCEGGEPGRCAVWTDQIPGMMIQKALHRIRPTKALDYRFLYYNLLGIGQSKGFEQFFTGSTIKHLPLEKLAKIEVLCPPLPVQRRIADVLSAYDGLISNSQRRIRILEDMARTVYREWFVEFRFPGYEKSSSASSLREVPKGWEGYFRQLAIIERDGINPFEFADEEFEHFSLPAFDNGRQPVIELGATILSGKYGVEDSTVLLSKLNPRIPRIWLPVPSGRRRAISSTEFIGLKPRPGVTREFIYAKCCSEEFAGQFGSLAIGTSTSHQRVKPENLLALRSTVPDSKTIAEFTKRISPMLIVCGHLRSQIKNLNRTRDLLLPRLMSGQVELKTN
jgi:type I restriction enzyme S subunit